MMRRSRRFDRSVTSIFCFQLCPSVYWMILPDPVVFGILYVIC